jgi:probable HAF family extracellular repeat protein
VAAEDIGNAFVLDIADTAPFITAVGVGSIRVGSTYIRKGFVSSLSPADDVGSPPRMIVLDGFGGPATNSAATAVNEQGDVVGYAGDAQRVQRPFLRRAADGVMTDLGTLGGPAGRALDIGSTGHVVGQADVAPGIPHAFLLPPGMSMIDLGTLGGVASSAHGVNDDAEVVGESWTAEGTVHAFVWRSGSMIDLNTLIPPTTGWTLTRAEAINDAGVIVGWGQLDGRTTAFVLEPAACPGDFNADGAVTSQDFFDFLGAFFKELPAADVNADGSINSQDFFDFLAAFFEGCRSWAAAGRPGGRANRARCVVRPKKTSPDHTSRARHKQR